MKQNLDATNRERDLALARQQEIATENATLAARVQYVDRNMTDLEFLLEHAVQREEKALQREKQALAALQQTQKSSENALGQGFPHEVDALHRNLYAAEQHCNALDSVFRRCLHAAQAKDALVDKLRKQLDESEDQLQKVLVCTAEELDAVRAQVRKSTETFQTTASIKAEVVQEQEQTNTELLRMYDEQLKEANRKISELEKTQAQVKDPDGENAPTNLALIQMHEEQHALLVEHDKQLKASNTRVEELESELVKLKLSGASASVSDSSHLDGLYTALESSRQKQREAEERAQVLEAERRSLLLANQKLIASQEIEAQEQREKRMRQVVARLMGKNVQWAFEQWCDAMDAHQEQALSQNDPAQHERGEIDDAPPTNHEQTAIRQSNVTEPPTNHEKPAIAKSNGTTRESSAKMVKRESIVKEGEDLTAVLARRRQMGDERHSGGGPTHPSAAPQGDRIQERGPGERQEDQTRFPHTEAKSAGRVFLPPPPSDPSAPAVQLSDPGVQMASHIFGNSVRPAVSAVLKASTYSNVRPSQPGPMALHKLPARTSDSNEAAESEPARAALDCMPTRRMPALLLRKALEDADGGVHEALAEMIDMLEESCRNLEILPDVGDLAIQLVQNARLDAARFQVSRPFLFN